MAIQFVGWSVAKIGGLARILVTAYLLTDRNANMNPWGRKWRPYDFKAPVLIYQTRSVARLYILKV